MSLKINLLKKQNYKSMPWKNGRGFTSEIAIFPTQSTMEKNNFTWRLSSAEVTEHGPFSGFPGCERYLTVIAGYGLRLQFENENKVIDQNHFVKFSGESKVYCELVDGKITDLNLIVKRDLHNIQFKILNTAVNELTKGTSVIFVIEGSVKANDVVAEKFDTLMIETQQNEKNISILPSLNSKFVLITIS